LAIYFPFTAVIALFIAIVRNPRQPSAKTDVGLITLAIEVFEKIHPPSDILDKIKSLASQFQTESNATVERLTKSPQIEDPTDRPSKTIEADSHAQQDSLGRRPSQSGTMSNFEQDGM
jgi:hypothetical protein